MKQKIKRNLLLFLIVLLVLPLAFGVEDIITNLKFTHTSSQTTVSWNTDVPTNATLEYSDDLIEVKLNDERKTSYHEFTFDTQPGKEYDYVLKSCTDLLTPPCAERSGKFEHKTFFLEVNVPKLVKTPAINIAGKTLPDTLIKVFVNDYEKKRTTTREESFSILNIPLNKEINKVKIEAVSSGDEKLENEYTVIFDKKPPAFSVDVPEVSTQKTLKIEGTTDEPIIITLDVKEKDGNKSVTTNKSVEGNFSVFVELFDGKNELIITAKDKAGYKTKIEKEIYYDSGPPQFIETNLEKLSPSYKKAVMIRGKVNEKASITVFLNGKAGKTVLTNEDGTFAASIILKTAGIDLSVEEMRGQLKAGTGYMNKIWLQATDIAGLSTKTQEYAVEYAICGSGAWFQSRISQPVPEILTPRLLLEGLQQLGLGFELEYKGNKKIRIQTNGIKAQAMPLSPAIEKQYDNGWIAINTLATPVRGYENEKVQGYIQINFNPIDVLSDNKNATTMDKLKALSDYRKGDCLLPGLGCGRFMLELEIPFQEITKKYSIDPYTRERVEEEVLENKFQKICLEQEIAIDQIIPPDIIPSGLLKIASSVLEAGINTIETVLNPLETIGKITFTSCLIAPILLYVLDMQKSLQCDLSSAASFITGKGFNPDVAKVGMCEVYTDTQTKSSCEACTGAIETYNDVKEVYQQVCDRVACPDAPTLQTYIKRQKGRLEKIKGAFLNLGAPAERADISFFKGSDCAAWLENNKKGQRKIIISNENVKGIYEDYLKHKEDAEKLDEKKESSDYINCAELHPATAECCGYEYMQKWGSACGISAIEFLDTFDEIKESACLSAQRFGKNKIELKDGKSIECNKLWNSIAGFCEPKGGPVTEHKKVVKFSDKKIKELGLSEFSPEQMLYLFAIPLTKEKIALMPSRETSNLYSIKLGYVIQVLDFQKSDKAGVIAEANRHFLTPRLEAIELDEKDIELDKFFTQEIIEEYYKTGKLKKENVTKFRETLCKAAGHTSSSCIHKIKAQELYEDLINIIGTEDKEYIVRPASGLLRSGQCICLPGIIGNLKKWKGIMSAVNNCLKLIQVSGEGSEGVCQAVLETHVCELIYDGLRCFSDAYSPTRTNDRVEVGGLENFLSALTTSAGNVGSDIEERYGTTGMFKALFVDKKLLHSICGFAFTGTWSLDVDTLFDMSINEIPIESTTVLFPCNRRFIGYNPASYPVKGSAQWLYHFGVMIAAGSDLNLRLKLKCSEGYKCKESDGFVNGQCDCRNGEKEIEITPPEIAGTVSKFDVLNKEIFAPIQSDDALVRYDTAELIWSWTDPDGSAKQDSVTCSIGERGTPPPAFCSFDMFTLSFRCIFGEQESGIRFRDLKIHYPPYPKIQGKNVFKIEDKLNATLAITQDYPDNAKPGHTKFLGWRIESKGKVIEVKDPANNEFFGKEILKTNGDYNINIEDLGLTIKPDWLRKGSTRLNIYDWDLGDKKAEPSKVDIRIKAIKEGVTYKKDFALLVVIDQDKNDKTKTVYRIHEAKDMDTIADKVNGFDVGKTYLIPEGIYTTNSITFNHKGLTFEITLPILKHIGKAVNKRKEFKIIQASADICKDEKLKYVPQQFLITFQSYDADKYGAPSTVQSIDTATGTLAEIKKDFHVVCEIKETEVKAKEGKNIADIRNILSELIKKTRSLNRSLTIKKKEITGQNYPQQAIIARNLIKQYLDEEFKSAVENINSLKISISDEGRRILLNELEGEEMKKHLEYLDKKAKILESLKDEEGKILEEEGVIIKIYVSAERLKKILESLKVIKNKFVGYPHIKDKLIFLHKNIEKEKEFKEQPTFTDIELINMESLFLRELVKNSGKFTEIGDVKLPAKTKQPIELWRESIDNINKFLSDPGIKTATAKELKDFWLDSTFIKEKELLLANIIELLERYGEFFKEPRLQLKIGLGEPLESEKIKKLKMIGDMTKGILIDILTNFESFVAADSVDEVFNIVYHITDTYKQFMDDSLPYYDFKKSYGIFVTQLSDINSRFNRKYKEHTLTMENFKEDYLNFVNLNLLSILDKTLFEILKIKKADKNFLFYEKREFEIVISHIHSEIKMWLNVELDKFDQDKIINSEKDFVKGCNSIDLYRFNKYMKQLNEGCKNDIKKCLRDLLKPMIEDKFSHVLHPEKGYEKGEKLK